MAIPESIKKKANQVRNEVYGRDVREALASGIEEAGDIADKANTKSNDAVEQVDNIQAQVNQLVVEGDSSVEAAQARVDAEGKSYPTLKARLDEKETEFSSQLAQIAHQVKASGEDDTLAINEAIDYVDNNGGGQVLLVDPTYNYSGDIHIKESVELVGTERVTLNNNATENARIIFYSIAQLKNVSLNINVDYNDSMFLMSNEFLTRVGRRETSTSNAKTFFEKVKAHTPYNSNTPNKVAVELFATRSDLANATSAGFWGVTGKDFYFEGFNTMFLIKTEHTGWINGNYFEGTINDFEHAVRVDRSDESLGIDYNTFKLNMQTSENTKDIFVDGVSSNNYNECQIWDMNTYTNARVGTGIIKNNMNGIAVPKERYAQYLLRNRYHLIGRFSRFDGLVNHVSLSVNAYGNNRVEYHIRGYDEKVEKRVYGIDRFDDIIKFFKRELPNGEVELYLYNDNDVETEVTIYIESFRSFFPSPLTYYSNIEGAIELTNVEEYYPTPRGMYERGSNENGTWVKYADGTMICRLRRPSNLMPNKPSGALFTSDSETWIYPQEFISTTHLNVHVETPIGTRWATVTTTPTTSSVNYAIISITQSDTPSNVFLTAIGLWK